MRALICLCLATCLWAGEPPQPGLDRVFLARILEEAGDGSKPWKTFRIPEASASAVVEVIGELTKEEMRQVIFQEFLVWFRADLQRFWKSRGWGDLPSSQVSAVMPVVRNGGNPVQQNAPLMRIGF